MVLKEFKVFFDQSQFYAGQRIVGNIKVCVQEEPVKAKSITLTLQGSSKVHWTTERTYTDADNRSQTTIDVYQNHKDIVTADHKQQLWRSDEGEIFPVGEFSFPFQFLLPHNIPSSFESTTGNVRYTVQAKMNVPKQHSKIEHNLPITIERPFDIISNTSILKPMTKTIEKTFCCLWCSSGPVTLVLSLPSSLAVPGDKILPTVEVDNASRVNLRRIALYLIETTKYIAGGSTKYERSTICHKELGKVDAHNTFTWVCSTLEVPINVANLAGCSNIKMSYCLELSCEDDNCCSLPLSISVPIYIGKPPQNSESSTLIKSKETKVGQQSLRQRKH